MSYLNRSITLRTITQLHVGCGQEVGIVDLPIIRERSTGFPYIPGSGLRGSLRNELRQSYPKITTRLFGPENDSASSEIFSGCLAIHDSRILFYPVRSDLSIYLWITCPMVLQRYNRDIRAFKTGNCAADSQLLQPPGDDHFFSSVSGDVFLEEFKLFSGSPSASYLESLNTFISSIYPDLSDRVLVLSDSNFYHFVNYATIITQHNALTTAKTVSNKALFSIESLPPDTIFYSIVGATDERTPKTNEPFEIDSDEKKISMTSKEVADALKDKLLKRTSTRENAGQEDEMSFYLHIGGHESTGMGLTEIQITGALS